MIVYRAFIPHESPTLLGEAFARVRENLYVRNPETLVVIAPHGQRPLLGVSLSAAAIVKAADRLFQNDLDAVVMLRRETERIPGVLLSEENYFEARSIPAISFLTLPLPSIRTLSINLGSLAGEQHHVLGSLFGEVLTLHPHRFALIAIGNLSCILNDERAEPHDELRLKRGIVEALLQRRLKPILETPRYSQSGGTRCGLDPLTMMLGILGNENWRANILAEGTRLQYECVLIEFVV